MAAPVGILVHYAEIGIKGGNRPWFIKKLVRNMALALSGLPVGRIQPYSGRIVIYPSRQAVLGDEATERLRYVPGIASFSPLWRADLNLEDIKRVALDVIAERDYESFRVRSRRVFKQLPFSSLDVNREVGAHLLQHRPAKVKMKGAELELGIEMLPNGAMIYADKVEGLRGLPTDSGGTVACLLSGGIDSPLAAFRMLRRGCRVVFIHFHSHPFQSRTSQEKAQELADHLTRFQHESTLYLVPFGELQREIVTTVPPPLRVVLYRRFMVRIAARLAKDEGARALVTGESLGQVASQTLENLVAVDDVAPLPILRPLIGYDKQEIISAAERLGTYETSIVPDEDCCQLFTPKHPETRAKIRDVTAAEAQLQIDALCDQAIARKQRLCLRAPWWQEPSSTRNRRRIGEQASQEDPSGEPSGAPQP